MPKLNSKKKQEIIDHLVGNCDCDTEPLFEVGDVETLNKLDLEDLYKLTDNSNEEEESEEEETSEKSEQEEVEVTNKEEFKFNFENLPQDIQEDITFARNMKKQQKDQLIAKITANEEGLFTKEDLEVKSVDELQKIASYAGVKQPEETPRLGGHADVVTNSGPLDDVLDLPIMNW